MIAFAAPDDQPEPDSSEGFSLNMSRDDVIQRYANGGPLLVYATAEIPEAKADEKIGPGEWTLRQVIAHLVDSDLNGAERMKHQGRALTRTTSAPVRPKTSGVYISSARVGGRTKVPSDVARAR